MSKPRTVTMDQLSGAFRTLGVPSRPTAEDLRKMNVEHAPKIEAAMDQLFDKGITEKQVYAWLDGQRQAGQIKPRRSDLFSKGNVDGHEFTKDVLGADPFKRR